MKFINKLTSELGRIIIGAILFVLAIFTEPFDIEILTVILYLLSLAISGLPVFISAIKGIFRRDLLDEKFLMSVSSLGAIMLGEMSEGVAVMLFFLVGEYFEHRAVARSRKSIKALMDIRPDEATVLINGEEIQVDAEDVAVGSVIIVRSGERVPIDSVVISGSALLDTSSLTGESVPGSISSGDNI